MPALLTGLLSTFGSCAAAQVIRRFSYSPRYRSLPAVDRVRDGVSKFIITSRTTDPFVNLAIEDHLLRTSDPRSRILFTYVNRPCVVIGRNQNPWLEVNLAALKDGIPDPRHNGGSGVERQDVLLVRRRSGGGTVFHDEGNLNYSFIVPNDQSFTRNKHAEMVVQAIKSISSDQTCQGQHLLGPALKAGISVNERHDIVMPARVGDSDPISVQEERLVKVSGSAYKLTRGRALHHGTLLFSSPNIQTIGHFLRSPGRPYINAEGVESVRSPIGNLRFLSNPSIRETMRTNLENSIANIFQATYQDGHTSNTTIGAGSSSDIPSELISTITELKSQEWTHLQTPTFTFTFPPKPLPATDNDRANRKPSSSPSSSSSIPIPTSTKIHLKAQHGIITHAHISTSKDPGIAEAQAQRLRPALENRKLHDVTASWKRAFALAKGGKEKAGEEVEEEEEGEKALLAWLEEMLPPSRVPFPTPTPRCA